MLNQCNTLGTMHTALVALVVRVVKQGGSVKHICRSVAIDML